MSADQVVTSPYIPFRRAPGARLALARAAHGLRRWFGRAAEPPLVLRRVAPDDALWSPEATLDLGRPDLVEIGTVIAEAALKRPGGLMNAYVASAVEVALDAEALTDGAPVAKVRTPLQAVVAEVVDELQPCAAFAGLTLARDAHSGWSCVAETDPRRLHKALSHLVLRALSSPGAKGVVRVVVSVEARALRLSVLAAHARPEPCLFDLGGLVRMLRAMDAALVVEPAWAGCTALCIVLPLPSPAERTFATGPSRGARR